MLDEEEEDLDLWMMVKEERSSVKYLFVIFPGRTVSKVRLISDLRKDSGYRGTLHKSLHYATD